MTPLPLAGLRVLSFEAYGAAPYATLFLADFGADVIRIETGEGDFARVTGPRTLGAGDSLFYQTFNMNKRALALDLKADEDRALFHRLVADSDIVANNLRGNQPAKLGIDHPALRAVNPRIVCGHISAYGRTGSRADRPGYDFLMQAEAGIMALTGEPDAVPARVGLSMVDYMTGMMLAFGLLAAVRGAERSGTGCDVDVSLFDAGLHQLAYQGSWWLNGAGDTPRQERSAHPSTTPVQMCRTADGWIFVCCMNDRFWALLTEALGVARLASDARFVDLAARRANRAALTVALDAAFVADTTNAWVARLASIVPVAPVRTMAEALASDFVAEAGMIDTVAHPSGELRMLANPIRLDGARVPRRAAPGLDADGAAIRAAYPPR